MADIDRRRRRLVAAVLWAGALVLALVAAAVRTGVLPVAEDVRGVVAGALAAVAIADAALGVWFLQASPPS